MKLAICGFRKYETVVGLIEEEPLQPIYASRSDIAESQARKLWETGQCDVIYIQHIEGGYLNPVVGYEPTGRDWAEYFCSSSRR